MGGDEESREPSMVPLEPLLAHRCACEAEADWRDGLLQMGAAAALPEPSGAGDVDDEALGELVWP